MLFNSFLFIFAFLPLTLIVFFALAKWQRRIACGWLFAASVIFYAGWNPAYIGLLLGSIIFNYAIGTWVTKLGRVGDRSIKKTLLIAGISANILLLAYYKYADFFLSNLALATGATIPLLNVILPLGISFFTFTQIAFLVDAYRGTAREYNFVNYGLFVTFFPHLIAGPILHHKEMMPQFERKSTYRANYANFAVGLSIFALGLFKKVVLADSVAPAANQVFSAVAQGGAVTFWDAWGGALAYTVQIYFDFSGYSDMAIGLARLFGINLPLNFFSPYKATSIIEFWRRWHMTLSRFLRDYVYIPLGGNRKGEMRRYTNLFATMLLGGIWHGAGWTFFFWGMIHGFFLTVNHLWRSFWPVHPAKKARFAWSFSSATMTFLVVVLAWVFFRAESMHTALHILRTMFTPPLDAAFHFSDFLEETQRYSPLIERKYWVWVSMLLLISWFAPNTQQLLRGYRPALDFYQHLSDGGITGPKWQPGYKSAIFVTALLVISLLTMMTRGYAEFIYFSF